MADRGEADVNDAKELLSTVGQGLRLARLEQRQELLAQSVQHSLETVRSSLSGVQKMSEGIATKLDTVVNLQHAQDSNKSSIDDLRKTMGDLNNRLEEWFEDFDERNQRWKREHEAENENDKRELSTEIRTVRETVIRALGWGAGAGALVAVIVGGFIWSLNDRFTGQTESVKEVKIDSAYNRQLIDAQREKIHEVELYLARGGVSPQQPYVTKQQRTSK